MAGHNQQMEIEKGICSYFELKKEFTKVYDEEKMKLPYHINLLDITRANENAHSKILAELLQKHDENGRFEILESFFAYLSRHNKNHINFNNEFHNPIITAEVDRIDILVQDSTRTIIIENKICNAADQECQLKRYIDKVGCNKKKISVLYLVSDDEKRPTNQTWGTKEESYEAEFKDRFMIVHYRTHILPWLKDFILPECRIKDVYLRSAVEQYIDYLEGMFDLRKTDKVMSEELQRVIKKYLILSEQSEENPQILTAELKILDGIREQMETLRQEEEQNCWRKWAKKIQDDYVNNQNYKSRYYENSNEYQGVGVDFEYKENTYEVMLFTENGLRYGIGNYAGIPEEMRSKIETLGLKRDGWWLGTTTSFDKGFTDWETLMNNLKKMK